MIQCKSCGQTKPSSDYYTSNRSTCKECRKAYVANWQGQNRDTVREQTRERHRKYRTDPLTREKYKAIHRRYRSKPAVRAKDLAYAINRHAQRQQLLNQLKNVPCKDCENRFPPYCMDFDHVRGEKVKGVADMKGFSLERIMVEAAKCDIVCATCHRIRTHERKQSKVA